MLTDITWSKIAQPWSDRLTHQIMEEIDRAQLNNAGPHYVAFDADGTLWDADAGEIFFQYQIDHKLVDLPKDPWAHYFHLKELHPPKAYLWLTELCAPHPLSTVHEWAESSYLAKPLPIFRSVYNLIEQLNKKNIFAVVVSASTQWSVEPGAKRLGISKEHVFGVQTEVVNGHITKTQKGPVTWREGKAQVLKETFGSLPLFSCGNSDGDIHLLNSSRGPRLAVQTAPQESELASGEAKLLQLAKENKWHTHDYRL